MRVTKQSVTLTFVEASFAYTTCSQLNINLRKWNLHKIQSTTANKNLWITDLLAEIWHFNTQTCKNLFSQEKSSRFLYVSCKDKHFDQGV